MLTIDLQGRVALVTGGTRGIGRAITECLCRAGATTVCTHTGDPQYAENVQALIADLRNDGSKVEAVPLDACDPSATTALVEKIVHGHGKIDILVHNVGRNVARLAEEVTDEDWQKFLDINLTSGFYAVRAVLPHMVEAQHGRVILIGSSAVYSGGGGGIDYAAAKSGLAGMMMYLCKEYSRKGILTNTVHPCVIETDLLRERYPDEAAKQGLISQVPAGRLGKPSDIAGLVAYLASEWGDFICGQSILVDGGRTLFG